MRFRELLLEYSRATTARIFGQKLVNRVLEDNSASGRAVSQQLKKIIKDSGQEQAHDFILSKIELWDPTPNKSYMPWMCQRYCDGGIPLFEDFAKTNGYLIKFDMLKKSGYFKRNPDEATYSDVNRFKKLSDLGDFVAKDNAAFVSSAEEDRQIENRFIENREVTIVFNDSKFKVVIPHSEAASCFYGRNTQWCTAATGSHNYFNDYADEHGRLFIILDKKTNRRWQFCPGAEQYMDERDEPVNWNNFPVEIFELVDFKLKIKEKIDVLSRIARHGIPKIWEEKIVESLDRNQLAIAILSLVGDMEDLYDRAKTMDYTLLNTAEIEGPNGSKAILYDFGYDIPSLVFWFISNSGRDTNGLARFFLRQDVLDEDMDLRCKRAVLVDYPTNDGEYLIWIRKGSAVHPTWLCGGAHEGSFVVRDPEKVKALAVHRYSQENPIK